jgi:hypothetical protein
MKDISIRRRQWRKSREDTKGGGGSAEKEGG